MLFLLSPAKNLNETLDIVPDNPTIPALLEHAQLLMSELRRLAPHEIASLMHVSDKIALLNAERNSVWHTPFTPKNAKAAIYMFNGDVYEGIDAYRRTAAEINYLQQHVRLLSGLYGVLRPLDLMQPYRLEMGTAFSNQRGSNLYQFWNDIITGHLNQTLTEQNEDTVINLASQEYFKSVNPHKLNARLVTPVFKDAKNGTYKIISFYAKRARGLMVRYAAENALTQAEQLKQFDLEGYVFDATSSSENEWIFLRDTAGK